MDPQPPPPSRISRLLRRVRRRALTNNATEGAPTQVAAIQAQEPPGEINTTREDTAQAPEGASQQATGVGEIREPVHAVSGESHTTTTSNPIEEADDTNEAEDAEGERSVTFEHADDGQRPDDKHPVWTRSVERFKETEPERYEAIIEKLEKVRDLDLEVGNWESWARNELQEAEGIRLDNQTQNEGSDDIISTNPRMQLFRKFKAYLPALKSVKALAMGLSRLDPHKIAPLVVGGVFFVIEFVCEISDPSTNIKATDNLLKTSILISKWVACEQELQRMKRICDLRRIERESGSGVIQDIMETELDTLYSRGLFLISSIYLAGKTKLDAAVAHLIAGPAEWDLKYSELNTISSVCTEQKNKVETELKRQDEAIKVLDWIRNRSEDPEIEHKALRDELGIDGSGSSVAKWLCEAPSFSDWISGIRGFSTREEQATNRKRVFWLKGSVGTGKTTLIYQTVSHFQQEPIPDIRFVPYYCNAKKASKEASGPTNITIVRALCYQLAWEGGNVAKIAEDLHHESKAPGQAVTDKDWEKLFENLIESILSNGTRIIIVIDALDECKDMASYETLIILLKGLLGDSKFDNLYYLVSSRHHVPVKKLFEAPHERNAMPMAVESFEIVQNGPKEEMENLLNVKIESYEKHPKFGDTIFFKKNLRADLEETFGGLDPLEKYLGDHLKGYPRDYSRNFKGYLKKFDLKEFGGISKKPDDSLEAYLLYRFKKALMESAGGMFRWVEIWFGIFFPRNGKPIQRLEYAIELLKELEEFKSFKRLSDEETLKTAYSKLWAINQDGEQYKDIQIRLFRIVIGAVASLTPSQLLEAVNFNGPEIGRDELEGLYYNFLEKNDEGLLNFEHLSAKIFLSELKMDGEYVFGEEECRQIVADMSIDAIKNQDHQIWKKAGTNLMQWGLCAKKDILEAKRRRFWGSFIECDWYKIAENPEILGSYFLKFWLRQCCTLRDNAKFAEKMSEVIVDHGNSITDWLIVQSRDHWRALFPRSPSYRIESSNSLIVNPKLPKRERSPNGLSVDPFFFMVSFGFLPFSFNANEPVLLPKFHDYNLTTKNSDGKTVLHVACTYGNHIMIKGLIQLLSKDRPVIELLTEKDSNRCIPLHYAGADDTVNMLLSYEMGDYPQSSANCNRRSSAQLFYSSKGTILTPFSGIMSRCSEAYINKLLSEYQLPSGEVLNEILGGALFCYNCGPFEYLVENAAEITPNSDLLRSISNIEKIDLINFLRRENVCKIPYPTALRLVAEMNCFEIHDFFVLNAKYLDAPEWVTWYERLIEKAMSGRNLDVVKYLRTRRENVNLDSILGSDEVRQKAIVYFRNNRRRIYRDPDQLLFDCRRLAILVIIQGAKLVLSHEQMKKDLNTTEKQELEDTTKEKHPKDILE
ncbi:hypothetical protein TWF730_011289 [Orbilia blumenaviensis]|uniref:NACHT domain-containing protein n=1 Tax=Orbilia blumenaviensis TaxID=1796055 RepID=A0AAV9UKP4_9PEZI